MITPKYLLINLGFMFTYLKEKIQRIFRGYSDADIEDLDDHLAELILNRLCAFRDYYINSGRAQEYYSNSGYDIDTMIQGFSSYLDSYPVTKEEIDGMNKTMGLFSKRFIDLNTL